MKNNIENVFGIDRSEYKPFSFDDADDVSCVTPFTAVFSDQNTENVVFSADNGQIYYSKSPFVEFLPMNIPPGKVTAISISFNSRFLVICYSGGNLKLVDFTKKSVIVELKRKSDVSIVSVTFTADSNAFVAVNSEGTLFTFTIINTGNHIKLSEHKVFIKDLKLSSAFAFGGRSRTALLFTKDEGYISYLNEHTYIPLFSTGQRERISYKIKIVGENVLFYCVAGKIFCIITTKATGEWRILQFITFKQDAVEVHILSPDLNAVVFSDKSMRLVKSNNFVSDSYESKELTYALSFPHFFIPKGERILVSYCEKFGYITFFDFERYARELIDKKDFVMCMQLCKDIINDKETIFKLPRNKLDKETLVKKVIYSMMEAYILTATDFDDVSKMIDICFNFNIIDFITGRVFEFCKEKSMLVDYAIKMINSKTTKYLACVNDNLIDALAEMENEKWTNEISEIIIKSSVPFSHRNSVLNLAIKMNDTKLILHMFVTIFSDFISAVNFMYGKDEYVPLISKLITGAYPESNKKLIIAWMLCPEFPKRLKTFLEINEDQKTYKEIFKLLPIKISNCITINNEVFIDTVLRILPSIKYEKAVIFINTAAKIIVNGNINVPLCSINTLIRWAFTNKDMLDTRERLAQIINCMYPSVIVFDQLIDFCEAAGFTEVLKHYCLQNKEYNRIIRTMAACPERRNQIFPFIYENIEDKVEIKEAVSESLQILILLDTLKVIDLIFQHFPEMHDEFLASNAKPVVMYTYIKTIIEDKRYSDKLPEEVKMQYFELLCQFSPDEVLPLINETKEIKLESALPLCIKYRVVDACVHIYNMLGNPTAAIKYVADELEFTLYKIAKSKEVIKVTSLSGISFVPELAHPVHLLKTAINVLEKSPALGHTIEKMWTMMFKAFQAPLWIEKKNKIALEYSALTMLFASFVVEILPRTSPEFVMYILNTEFACLPAPQMKQILKAVVSYLNQRYTLNMTVERMVRDDCLELFHKTNSIVNKPAITETVRCSYCNNPITGAGNVGAVAFQCGHIFHNNSVCGCHRRCPICYNDKIASKGSLEPITSKIIRGERKLARVEFCLQTKNGAGNTELEGCGIYFCQRPYYYYENKIEFKPAKGPLPTPVSVFVEI